jgi:hypothetical protein
VLVAAPARNAGPDRSFVQGTTSVAFQPLVLSFATIIRPATLPKLDNGVEFWVVSMVNRLRHYASREGPDSVLLFSLCLILSPQLLKGMQSCLVFT